MPDFAAPDVRWMLQSIQAMLSSAIADAVNLSCWIARLGAFATCFAGD